MTTTNPIKDIYQRNEIFLPTRTKNVFKVINDVLWCQGTVRRPFTISVLSATDDCQIHQYHVKK